MTTLAFLFSLLYLKVVVSGCPDLTSGYGCHTGSCASGGLSGPWTAMSYSSVASAQTTTSTTSTIVIPVAQSSSCCFMCKNVAFCNYWLWLPDSTSPTGGTCYLYNSTPASCGTAASLGRAGSKCQQPGANNDPHMTGFDGTRFDFNGLPGKTYCLITDSFLHLNVKMEGYLDPRNESATAFQDGKAVRTWMREIGMVWKSGEKESHSLRMVVRRGKEAKRNNGYLSRIEVDSKQVPQPLVGKESLFPGDLSVKFKNVTQLGKLYEVERYLLKIGGALEMELKLRPAHPRLRREDDSMVHFSIGFNHLQASSDVHGVIGQTHRADHKNRTEIFREATFNLQHSIAADGESGEGFLDGKPADYVASDVMSTDCKFSRFSLPAYIE